MWEPTLGNVFEFRREINNIKDKFAVAGRKSV